MTDAADRSGRPTVGIIGGVGPQATVDLMQRIIDLTPADDDGGHIRMLVDNDPAVPSRIAALIEKTGPSPAPHLAQMARGLVAHGASLIAMPCNTAHCYLAAIEQAAGPVPVLDMVGLTATSLARMPGTPRRIGLVASPAVRLTALYEPALADHGMEAVYPRDDAPVLATIRAVKAGSKGDRERARISAAIADLKGAGAQAIVIACTEISALAAFRAKRQPSAAFDGEGSAVVDALDVLARTIVERAGAAAPADGKTNVEVPAAGCA